LVVTAYLPTTDALDAHVEGGMYDALSLCVYQAKEDDDFRSDDIKVITNWGEEEERKYSL
jgi:hypothetical protein